MANMDMGQDKEEPPWTGTREARRARRAALQALETEIRGAAVYRAALTCARKGELVCRKETLSPAKEHAGMRRVEARLLLDGRQRSSLGRARRFRPFVGGMES
jgi:uncharacterized membrane protein